MPPVFIDTAALYGLLFAHDELNQPCTEVLEYLIASQCRLITHRWVEYETLSKLKKNGAYLCDAYNELKLGLSLRVLEVDTRLEHESLQMFWTYRDKTWSVTDCVSFSMMQSMTLYYAFTSDHHFAEAGFFPLLEIFNGRPRRTFEHLL